MRQLLNLQGVFFTLAEHPGNTSRPFTRLLFRHAGIEQLLVNLQAKALGARAQMARQRFLEQFRHAPVPFQALRADAQTLRAAHQGGLGASEVVPVQVGRGVGSQQMKLDKFTHVITS